MGDDWREVSAEYAGERAFIGRNPSGASLQMGALNGQSGFSPMESILTGLAGCSGMTVRAILRKQRQPLDDVKVVVRGKYGETEPRIFTEIEIQFFLWGTGLDDRAVDQAVRLSEERYCNAVATLRPTAQIRSSYRILEPGQAIDPGEVPQS
jgi:putative redox protein